MKYIPKFERYDEAFPRQNIIKAINLTNKIVSRRTGSKIYSSYYPVDFVNKNGKHSGIYCLVSGNRVIRYNYKINNSAEITSIDFWLKKKKGLVNPDYTLETEGVNIVQLIDAIVSVLNREGETEFQVITESIKGKIRVNEGFIPKTGGSVSKKNTDSIGEWARSQDVSDERLENTRISVLWRDFQFWFKESAPEEFSNMSEMTFRNYILSYLKDRGLQNKFVRVIKVRTGNKEKDIITDDASAAAYSDFTHLKLGLNDKIDFMKQNILSVLRGYTNATVICGKSGIGKTTITNQLIKEEGLKAVNINGAIRNLKVLYGLFYNNNDPKTVLVMDDVNDVFQPNFMPIINAALDDHNPRIISFPLEVGKDIKKFQPELSYVGKVIVLTNLPKNKLPKAMFSRTVPVEITASSQEMVDQLRITLSDIMPEVDMKYKLEVLEFLEKLGKSLANIDYRIFKRCLIFRMTLSPSWKKFVFSMVS